MKKAVNWGVQASVENSRIRICFYDTGGGIPPEICDYLNEGKLPEREVHVMGLRIVRQIVKAHEGEIHVEAYGRVVRLYLGRAVNKKQLS